MSDNQKRVITQIPQLILIAALGAKGSHEQWILNGDIVHGRWYQNYERGKIYYGYSMPNTIIFDDVDMIPRIFLNAAENVRHDIVRPWENLAIGYHIKEALGDDVDTSPNGTKRLELAGRIGLFTDYIPDKWVKEGMV